MIKLRKVCVNNLKEIDLDLPTGAFIVFCGRSGSGKSSLVFDTLYAEGQRKYIETFSADIRRFLEPVEKPKAEVLDGIPVSIAVSSKHVSNIGRHTAGTVSGVYDDLRFLFAEVAHCCCPQCKDEIKKDTPQSIADELRQLFHSGKITEKQQNIQFAFPVVFDLVFDGVSSTEQSTLIQHNIRQWKEAGFVRGLFKGKPFRFDESGTMPDFSSAGNRNEPVLLIADRLTLGKSGESRIIESLETAMRFGEGKCCVLIPDIETENIREDNDKWTTLTFSDRFCCNKCGTEFPLPEPKLFSFNNVHGACPACGGFGYITEKKSAKICQQCGGTRLKPELLPMRIGGSEGKNISEVCNLRFDELLPFLDSLQLSESERKSIKIPLEHIRRRVGFLVDTGLSYLTLSRPVETLSSGELRRIRLSSVLGSSLTDVLYVLDEPSAGLHHSDISKVLCAVLKLRDNGNTVAVVEHNEHFLRNADMLVEIGPGAGKDGGNIVFQGTPEAMLKCPSSLTGEYLNGKRSLFFNGRKRKTGNGHISINNCTGNNLKNISVSFPLGVLCVVSGVSGAGKSSLVIETLYPAMCRSLGKECSAEALPFGKLDGTEHIEDVVLGDQLPVGRTPRSNPATYLKILDEIRSVFADQPEAKARNFTAGHFSFNTENGRCGFCKGDGFTITEMLSLPNLNIPCPECKGKRYREEVLEVLYRGSSIADVLSLTAREAFSFFRGKPKVQYRLKYLLDAGLDYIQLGQPANTLSGGESQRLKIAAHLARIKKNKTLFILDEPTAGLHFADIVQLLDCFDALLETGHSFIVIEHNPQIIQAADFVIELGPGAAENGGRIIS